MSTLNRYEEIVGKNTVDELRMLSGYLEGKVIQHINSTAMGGGVAEILQRIVPLMQELGVNAQWDVIKGNKEFFEVTKAMHNALHGKKVNITSRMWEIFDEVSRENIRDMNLYGDIMFIHDPQPAALIRRKNKMKGSKWIWRCHVDVSLPDKKVWSFLEGFANRYDAAVFSSPHFAHRMKTRQALISPSIDPFSDKNRELSQKEIDTVLAKYKIDPQAKPIVCQISRYDALKDPVGVIKAYKLAKKYVDCQLLLVGNRAADDPETDKVYKQVLEAAGGDPDIHALLVEDIPYEINAFQRVSKVLVQKSIREGFALTVSEALWKAKPVVASAVGGIPLQITHKYSGLLCHSIEGAAFYIKQLLNAPEYAAKLGANGREHIRQNFLLTRHLREHMLLFLSLYHKGDVITFGPPARAKDRA
ncbi:MAG: glycosyltransferase [Candidatus Omnitrophica bacterium]|nr:glycosyltransferase [Candidatus Omnitrophota bacterium]MBU1932570.1 glycosyltransferase [Candidatus Omnitrophota bacterium]